MPCEVPHEAAGRSGVQLPFRHPSLPPACRCPGSGPEARSWWRLAGPPPLPGREAAASADPAGAAPNPGCPVCSQHCSSSKERTWEWQMTRVCVMASVWSITGPDLRPFWSSDKADGQGGSGWGPWPGASCKAFNQGTGQTHFVSDHQASDQWVLVTRSAGPCCARRLCPGLGSPTFLSRLRAFPGRGP